MASITYFPVVSDEKSLTDLLSRAAWFLSFCPVERIYVPIASETLGKMPWRVAPGMDPAIGDRFNALRQKLDFVVAAKEGDLESCMSRADIILRWKKDAKPVFVSNATLTRWLTGKKRVWEVDPQAVRMEGSFYIEVGQYLTANKPALVQENRLKFDALMQNLGKFDRAYLLATGPSVSAYKHHDFGGALSIVCNSVILDESLMKEVEPQILVFADPIFHFGPSQYAASFRKALVESARQHDFTICLPFKYYSLFLEAVPELADRTIGIPFTKNREFNFTLDSDFSLKTTANILTFLMVPLAGTLADEVGILGCDGRPLSDDQYFWAHNAKTQINDKMANIREVHPGFFAIDYNDYYLEHCRVLEEQLRAGEHAGKRFHCLAFSHIPALSSRMKRIWRKFAKSTDPVPSQVIMLDPDMTDTLGHFLAYNIQLENALAKRGCDSIVLGSTGIDRELLLQHPNFRPKLNVKSWTLGATKDSTTNCRARDELLAAIDEVMAESSSLLYMYTGSLNHAEILAEATRRYASLYVNINLFWLSVNDFLSDAAYVERWRTFVHWLDRSGPRFIATVPTIELRDEIAHKFGVILDVAPHPSTAFPDKQLMKHAGREFNVEDVVNVLFPGSLRSEKGYSLGVDCAKALGNDHRIRTTLRYVTTASTPDNLQEKPSGLPSNVTLITGMLNDEAFMQLLVESDVVVLPYSPDAFSKRTSGLLIDALACGRPAVVVDGTWLAGHVRRYGCGVVIPDATVESLCSGIRKVVADLSLFCERTRQAAETYFRDNSWEGLVNFLLAPFDCGMTYPRLLIIDLTRIGGNSATARVKEVLFRGWPQQSLGVISFDSAQNCLRSDGLRRDGPATEKELFEASRAFAPDVVYYRAVEHELVSSFARRAIEELERPYVVHLMDDWPTRLHASNPKAFARIDASLRQLLIDASAVLSVGEAMSAEFGRRYGVAFTAFANAVDPAAFPPRKVRRERDEFIVSYAGALADDMVLSSVTNTAFAIDSLSSELNIRFNIHTRPPWLSPASKACGDIDAANVLESVPTTDYYAVLQDSDANLIAYNFDEKSRDYIGYSIANKMPEYLASGTPILAIGPPDVATIAYLKETGSALVVDRPDQSAITDGIRRLVESRGAEMEIQQVAREIAFSRHNIWDVAVRLHTLLADVAAGKRNEMTEQSSILGPYSRSYHAHWDETQAVAQLYASNLQGSTMIDIGAHHGSALMPFLHMGWRIFAFEPDENNRAYLMDRLAKHKYRDRVTVDARAVSDHSEKNLSFYRSDVSSGISGLSAFHDSHHEAQRVDTVSLSEFLINSRLASIDFLKIDTEGHDLFVLKGFPWDRFKPAVVECEFEDSKTVPLGYTFHDLSEYLVGQGYTVYVSEWHPVIRYGVRHDWNRLVRYPCELAHDNGWGNLLAFREPIDEPMLVQTVYKTVKQDAEHHQAATGQSKFRVPSESNVSPSPRSTGPGSFSLPRRLVSNSVEVHVPSARSRPGVARVRQHLGGVYATFATAVRAKVPPLFRLAQMAVWILRTAWRHKPTAAAMLVGLTVACTLPLYYALARTWRYEIWGTAAAVLAIASAGVVVREAVRRLAVANAAVVENATHSVRQAVNRRVVKLEQGVAARDAEIRKLVQQLQLDSQQSSDAMRKEVARLAVELEVANSEARASDEVLRSEIEKSLATTADALRKELTQARVKLDAEIKNDKDSVAYLRERVAASERQIGAMRYPDAPATLVFFGHHKCASRFFRSEVFGVAAEATGARVRKYEIKNPPFHYSMSDDLDLCNMDFKGLGKGGRDVVLFSNATARSLNRIRRGTKNWKGIRIIRDPRQVLVSNYLHHKGNHHTELNGWIWDQLATDKPILQELPVEEGLLYELDHITKQIIEMQILCPFDDQRVMTIKIEDFSKEPKAHLRQISEFLGVADIAGIDFSRTSANPGSGPWQNHFTSRLRQVFKERYGQALIDLGYAEDFDW